MYKCDVIGCDREFTTKMGRSIHKSLTHGIKSKPIDDSKFEYGCVCGRRFKTKQGRSIHKNVTHGIKPEPPDESGYEFGCPEVGCDRRYKTKGGLGKHRVQNHGYKKPQIQKAVQCPYCPRSFDTYLGCQIHISRSHPEERIEQERIHPCHIEGCGFRAESIRGLRLHLENAHNIIRVMTQQPRKKRSRYDEKILKFIKERTIENLIQFYEELSVIPRKKALLLEEEGMLEWSGDGWEYTERGGEIRERLLIEQKNKRIII